MKKIHLSIVFALTSGLMLVGSAHAATANSTLDVTALVGQVCTVSTTPVAFNVVDQAVDTLASGSITVTCNTGMAYDIALDAGQNYNGAFRGVFNGGFRLDYDLGSNKFGQPWGDNGLTNPAPSIPAVASGGADIYSVDGILPGGQLIVPDGVYSDVVGVTVTY